MNLSDLAAVIGRVQLKKLPQIVARRRKAIAEAAKALAGCEAIAVPAQIPGAEPSYWFWRLEVNLERIACGKDAFCKALAAEGLPVGAYYRAMPHTFDWFKNRRVFGTSGLPWSSPLYKGDPKREFPCPNATRSIERQITVSVTESWGTKEAEDAAAIFRKVGKAYLK
jgi:perosamine synthetase